MKKQLLSGLIIGATLFAQVATANIWKWVALTSGTANTLWGVQFLDANNGFACGNAGTVLKTTDGGTTWTPINISTSNPVRQVSFTSTTQGWAAVGDPGNYMTTGGLYVTSNGGTTWTPVTWTGSPFANLSVQFFSATSGYVGATHYTSGTGTDTYYTSNGGTSWTSNPANIDWNWIYDMSFLNATTGWTVGDGLTMGYIFHTTNGGTSWSYQDSTANFYYGIDFKNANVGYAVGGAGTIVATTNGGTTWSNQTSGTSVQLNGVSFASTTTGWTAGNTGTILITTNAGVAWSAETSGTSQNLNAIVCFDSNTAWAVGNGGTILKREFVNGIDEINAPVSMSVYPNPFSSLATILIERHSDINAEGMGMVKIYDVFGKEIKSMPVNLDNQKTQVTIERDNMATGLYIYKVLSGTSILGEGKLLVN